jgi:hypothetical protein
MGSNRLLQDIHATYKWLNGNAAEARSTLLFHMDDKIFLNLPVNQLDIVQNWTWKSARQLVFNIAYDTIDLAAVGEYLSPFRPLLLAAGVMVLSDPTCGPRPAEPHNDFLQIRTVFNNMREAGQLTDITLTPKQEMTSTSEAAKEKLMAHKCFLAAAVPHLKDGLLSGMEESSCGEYPFEGSIFGASAMLGKSNNVLNGRSLRLISYCRVYLHWSSCDRKTSQLRRRNGPFA